MRLRTITTAMAALAVFTAGCDAIGERVAEEAAEKAAEQAGGGDVDLDFDEEGGNINIETSEGSMSLGSGGDLPESFPDDLPLPPGDFEVASSLEQADSDGASLTMALLVEDSHDDLVTHYEEALADSPWEVTDTQTMSMGEDMESTTFVLSNGEQEGTLGVQRVDEDTMVNYSIGDADA